MDNHEAVIESFMYVKQSLLRGVVGQERDGGGQDMGNFGEEMDLGGEGAPGAAAGEDPWVDGPLDSREQEEGGGSMPTTVTAAIPLQQQEQQVSAHGRKRRTDTTQAEYQRQRVQRRKEGRTRQDTDDSQSSRTDDMGV